MRRSCFRFLRNMGLLATRLPSLSDGSLLDLSDLVTNPPEHPEIVIEGQNPDNFGQADLQTR